MFRLFCCVAVIAAPIIVHAETEGASTQLSAGQLFALADTARAQRDFNTAQAAYEALKSDPDPELRNEARFRLAMMLADDLHRYTDAAIEFRHILDEKPAAARVRLELARMLAMTGDMRGAERALRAAQATGLPPDVQRMVRFYTNALTAQKPFGGSVELAIAPDSNINRATRSDTLGTVIGNFTLGKDAQAQSGVGLNLRTQAYWREGLENGTDLLVRLSAGGNLYRQNAFNDILVNLQIGPQYRSGRDRISIAAGPTWRWFGNRLYSISYGGTAEWQHPTGKRSQLRIEGGIVHVDNQLNSLQVADDFTVNASFDRALSARTGIGIQGYAFRETARDPGYSLTSGGTSLYAYREVGRTTLIGTAGYSHLEADARLFLYPDRRVEDRYSASLAATLRAIHVGAFSPLVRVKWERNRSSIEIYDYKRISAEFGMSSAF
jgi:outer membrane protein